MEGESSPIKEDEGDDGAADIKATSTPVRGGGDDGSERDESRLSASPDRDLHIESRIPALVNRTIPGSCCQENRGSLSWGQDGCLAYGCGSLVVVVEAATSQSLQVLSRHRSPVVKTAWSPHEHRRLSLASADIGGQIFIWDLLQGEKCRQLSDGNQPVMELRWLDSRLEKTGHLLLAIHPPNHLVLWNTNTGLKVWKVSYNENILGFDIDPFNCFRLMFRSTNCVMFIQDFHPEKCPKSEGSKFYMVGKRGSAGRGLASDYASSSEDRNSKGRRLSKIMRQMVLGDARQNSANSVDGSECLNASFHKGVKNLIILAFSKEVLLVDTELSQALGSISLERAHSSLAGIRSSASMDILYILHESGSISVWTRKDTLSILSTPSMSRSHSMLGLAKTPIASGNNEDEFNLAGSDVLLEVSYESKVQSDHVRMGKNCKVLGISVNPISEKQVSFFTSDGRLYILDLLHDRGPTSSEQVYAVPSLHSGDLSGYPKLTTRSILGSASSSLCVVKMCPPLTVKNWREYSPLLAAGSSSGNILIYNSASGCLVREVAVHTSEVRGLEWSSTNPAQSVISFSYHPLTASNLVRNELIHTNILTGKVRVLRGDRGEECRITMVRVSHAKQYFVLAFTAAPFELWDLRKLCLLRTMPKKFPLVTALVWSPMHRSKKKSGTPGSRGSESDSKTHVKGETAVLVKEHILFTDLDSQLYHFSVEGHSIRDGTRIPAETGIGTVNTIACKSDLIVRGDTDGNINIWNIKARQSKNVHTGRGNIKHLAFSPGRGNMKVLVLYADGVAIWDVKELEMINELRCPQDIQEVVGADWAASDKVLVLCRDGGIRIMGLSLGPSVSPVTQYFREQPLSCPAAVLNPKLFSKLAFSLTFDEIAADLSEETSSDQAEISVVNRFRSIHCESSLSFVEKNLEYAHLFGFQFEKKFWHLIYHLEKGMKLARNYDAFRDRASYIEQEEEKCKLHLNRATDRESRNKVTARLLCLGKLEPAVKLLLESEPNEESFLSDQLLACLISTTSTAAVGNHMSTTKMVATKLIAEGKLWSGIQLLCLVGKVWDACTYLRASKHWQESLWLAKCRLGEEEFREIIKKHAEHLISLGQLQEAALLHASNQNWESCLEVLHLGQYRGLAVKLLHYLDYKAESVLAETVQLEGARFLFEVGHKDAANFFCDKIGDKGTELRKEFLHL